MVTSNRPSPRAASGIGGAPAHIPTISLTVNGEHYELEVGSRHDMIGPADTLAHTLRENLGLTGTKIGCDRGACGACTVLMDGKPILSCMTLTVECDGKRITTIEGLANRLTGQLHPVQQAFINNTAFQCGFCTPGMIVTAKALLDRNPSPSEAEIKDALAGNFCRCGSWYLVIRAVKEAAAKGGQANA